MKKIADISPRCFAGMTRLGTREDGLAKTISLSAVMGMFDLVEQLEFYGSYHNNKWNQLIHLIFVPTIFLTACIGLCYTGPLVQVPDADGSLIEFNGAFVLFLVYAIMYLCIDVQGAIVANAVLFGCLLGANYMFHFFGPTHAWKYASVVHVISWVMQIFGHRYFEKRNPALLDNLAQAFLLAPLFVCMEVVFHLGFRQDIYRDLKNRVGRNIAAFRKAQADQGKRSKKCS